MPTPPVLIERRGRRYWAWRGDLHDGAQRIAVGPERLRRWIGAQSAHFLAMRLQPTDGLGDRSVVRAALKIGEEHVAPEALLARARLDLRQVHAAEGELRQAAHEPPRLLRAHPPEDQRRLPRTRRRVLGRARPGEPDEARLV